MAVRIIEKKPVRVRAVQFTGDNEAELQQFTYNNFWLLDEWDRKHSDDPECIAKVLDKLHSTWVGVKLNQWIIEGVRGEFYPCDNEVLVESYRFIDD
jgi:hypothetical protein